MIRALHSVDTYLNLSENWIYPQIIKVPNVESRVVCDSLANQESFPIDSAALTLGPPPWNRGLGVPRVVNVAARLGGFGMANKIRPWAPEIIHAHFGSRGWSTLDLMKRLNVPMVTSFYGYDAWMLPQNQSMWRRCSVWRQRYEELFDRGHAVLVEGPAMGRRVQELGCPPEKVRIQRIGVDVSAMCYQPKSFAEGLNVVMVGRFVEKKGFVNGLRACGMAISGGADIKVTIVGDAAAHDAAGWKMKQELQALAEGPELSGRVRFAGFLPMKRMRETLAEHNVLLCPSRHAANGDAEGGSPVVLTEAMAMGLLCVGTSHCDIPEVILDRKTGYICKEDDAVDMANVLCGLSTEEDRLKAVTECGRRHIEEHFSMSRQLKRLASLYQSVKAES